MFEHLDDPRPPTPPAGAFDATVGRGRRLRRRHRLIVGSTTCVVALVVGVAGAAAVVDRRLDDLERVEVTALSEPAPGAGEARTVLLVGADSTEGLAPDDPIAGGGRTGVRSDTVVLVRVDPAAGRIAVLPIPRDLWVDIPGQGGGRINSAIDLGGPDLLIDALGSSLGIEVDHYVEADFDGAIDIGDSLGGLSVAFPQPVRNAPTGFELAAGCQRLDGDQLLALARARHLEGLVDGAWVADPSGDFGRIERQQALARAFVDAIAELDASDPATVVRFVDAAVRELTVDDGTTAADLLDLVRSLQAGPTTELRLPVTPTTEGGATVLALSPGYEATVDSFAAGTPLPDAPGGASTAGVDAERFVPQPC